MPQLEDIDIERAGALLGHQPRFFLALGVAGQQQTMPSEIDAQHHRRFVGVPLCRGPRGIGSQHRQLHTIQPEGAPRPHTLPRRLRFPQGVERLAVPWAGEHEGRLPPARRTQRPHHTCRAPGVIVVRVREHEQRHLSATPSHIRHHDAAPRIAALPAPAGIHENPASAWRTQRQGIPLPDVQHMQLQVPVSRHHGRLPEGGGEHGGRSHHPTAAPTVGRTAYEQRHRRAGPQGGSEGGGYAKNGTGHRGRTLGHVIEQCHEWLRGVCKPLVRARGQQHCGEQGEKQRGLEHANQRRRHDIGQRRHQTDATEGPGHERRHDQRGDEASGDLAEEPAGDPPLPMPPTQHPRQVSGCWQRVTVPFPASVQRPGRHQRRHAAHTELPAEIVHDGGLDGGDHRPEGECRPFVHRALPAPTEHRDHEHDGAAHRGRREAKECHVGHHHAHTRRFEPAAGEAQGAAKREQCRGDDRDMHAADRQQVHKTGIGVAITHRGVDAALIGNEQRAHEWCAPAKGVIDDRPHMGAPRHEWMARAVRGSNPGALESQDRARWQRRCPHRHAHARPGQRRNGACAVLRCEVHRHRHVATWPACALRRLPAQLRRATASWWHMIRHVHPCRATVGQLLLQPAGTEPVLARVSPRGQHPGHHEQRLHPTTAPDYDAGRQEQRGRQRRVPPRPRHEPRQPPRNRMNEQRHGTTCVRHATVALPFLRPPHHDHAAGPRPPRYAVTRPSWATGRVRAARSPACR